MMFAIDPQDLEKIRTWLNTEVYPQIVTEQKKDPDIAALLFKDSEGRILPYEGAIGGSLTYHFTPTSLGTVVTVSYRDFVLDLTDYASW